MTDKSRLLVAFVAIAVSGCTSPSTPEDHSDDFVGPTAPALLTIYSEYWHSSSGMVRLVPGELGDAPASCVLLFHRIPHDNAECSVYLEPEDATDEPWYLEAHFDTPKRHAQPQGLGDLSVDAFDSGGVPIGTWYGNLAGCYHQDYSGVTQ